MPLADLADDAHIQLVPCDPPLGHADAIALSGAGDKLFAQFAREGRVAAWAIEAQVDGAVLAIAWQGDEDLSGCSRDKIARLLLAHEQRDGRRLLSAPPIVVAGRAGARCVDRAGLRALAARGEVDAGSVVYDLRAATLGAWRRASAIPIAQSAFAGVLAAPVAQPPA